MPNHLAALLLMALIVLARTSNAQTVYRCSIAGKTEYRDQPCPDGRGGALAVAPAPRPDPSGQQQLRRQEALLADLLRQRREREAREAREAKQEARASRAGAALRQRCAKLALQQRWAEEDIAAASSRTRDHLRRKAQRHAAMAKLECPA